MRRMRFLVSLALALALVPGVATAKKEPGPPPAPTPTLTGESFSDENPTITGACNLDGTGTVTFTASGIAGPPYPGPFTATGSATLSDQPIAGPVFHLQSFTETFTINSEVGQVTGNKFLPATSPTAFGICGPAEPGITTFWAGTNLEFFRYTAEINTPDGRRFTDQGSTQVGAMRQLGPGTFESRFFFEAFVSDLTEPILVCDKFKDKPGTDKDKCKDKNNP
jgi:hypothetical protein